MTFPSNVLLADKLREMADILEVQHADGYRITAYRRAARTLLEIEKPIDEIVRNEGFKGVIELPGIGRGIGTAIVEGALTDRLGHRHFKWPPHSPGPPVALLLDLDRQYRTKAGQGQLRKIAPKRFNPAGEAWLPVLHASRNGWQFTVLFSNTQRAHELQKTNDWVVAYFHTDSEPEAQCTIVTETRGPLEGRRVVRGREGDCIAYYAEGDCKPT